ncbi:L-threonylcarbamoyladenylate synthase [Ferribacterium limneticum]|uniref:L-threonylcarbamoyladenylate synthase n=1 Tax=Ferribacterium limneticum TaxID=76259 RepID=UPI001CF94B80|nr:L-threonylcarbamoyladenylate synthase [Ferribacterium limneticum]UCV28992.1 threonylcarbamoyl-AMP synthase [Ferribacterium limneticum]UCV32910.1 threonylcarbamoyl-AMP synthase [Ferribacterium limneticum]
MTPSDADYQRAVDLLRAGELVAIPTETVYGLGADAANPAAVAKIFAAKGRPADHPLIVHLAGHDAVDHWAEQVPDVAWELMETFWPGPLTVILKKQAWVPDAVTGGQDTVGLRVPGHPVALELLRRFAAASGEHAGIAAPSANRFGRISPTTASHVAEELGDAVPMILDGGPCAVGIESTIVDCSRGEPVVLRPGHISPLHLEAIVGRRPAIETAVGAPRVSGSLEAHYAPVTPLRMVAGERLLDFINAQRHRGGRCGVISPNQPPQAGMPHAWRLMSADPVGYAHDIYAALRDMDHAGVDLIVVESLPEGAEWTAVADRLRRAVAGAGQA